MSDETTYTAEQQETLESGLRMLARMIVRAHLRRQGLEGSRGTDTSRHQCDAPGERPDPRP